MYNPNIYHYYDSAHRTMQIQVQDHVKPDSNQKIITWKKVLRTQPSRKYITFEASCKNRLK
jgi:hypothetical protein